MVIILPALSVPPRRSRSKDGVSTVQRLPARGEILAVP